MELMASQLEYEFADKSGYRFKVVCTKDAESGGWGARVEMTSRERIHPEGAIAAVLRAAREFVRQAEKVPEIKKHL